MKRIRGNVIFVGSEEVFSRIVRGMKKTLNEKNMPRYEDKLGTIYQVVATDIGTMEEGNIYYWTRTYNKCFHLMEENAFPGIQEEVNE